MGIILLILFIGILLYILVQAAEYVEEAFVFLAKKLKMNEFFVGFGILGVITSLPEISIAISSSEEAPDLSIGNLLGATLILLTLVIGLSVIKYGNLSFKAAFGETEILLSLASISLIVILSLDKSLSVSDGIVLCIAYGLYLLHISSKFRSHAKARKAKVFAHNVFTKFFKAGFSIIILLIAASLLVDVSVELAEELGVTQSLVGLFIVALGTNIPEFTLLITSTGKETGVKNLVIGNFLGSASANVGIAGLLAILSNGFNFENYIAIVPVSVILTITLIFFLWFSWTGKEITKKEAVILISIYFAFVIAETVIIIESALS